MALDAGSVTENSLVSNKDGGRQMANIIYVLYLIGFVLPLTAIVGAVLAYVTKDNSTEPYVSHMKFQFSIFLKGLIYQAVILVLYLITSLIAAVTFGIGAIMYVLPVGVGIWWFVWTLIKIIQGMQALGRHEGMPV